MDKFGFTGVTSLVRGAALAGAMFAAQAHAQDIKLGFLGDLSGGPAASFSMAAVAGIEAAIEDVNKAGGVLGHKLTLVVRDDQGQPARSIQNVTELVDSEKVAAVLGPSNSGNAMAWKRIPTEKKIIAFMVIAEGTDVTKPLVAGGDNYFFRNSLYDRAQAAAVSAYAAKQGAKNVGLLSETTGYGEGGLRDLQALAKINGLNVVAAEKFGASDADMTSQLTKMKAAGVDTVLVWAQGTPLGLTLRSMEKLNYFPAFLASGGVSTPSFFDAAGPKLAARPLSVRTIMAPETDAQKQLYKRVEAKLSSPAAFTWSIQGYDGVMLLAAGMKQAGSTEGPKVREALENLAVPVQGMFKVYNKPFSKTNHEALSPSDVKFVRWNDGKLAYYSDEITKSLTPGELNR